MDFRQKAGEAREKALEAKNKADAILGLEGLTPEQDKQATKLLDEAEALFAQADDLDAKAERHEKLEAHAKAAAAPRGRKTSDAGDAPVVGVVRSAAEDDPMRGFKSPREFCLAVVQAGDRVRGTGVDERLKPLATVGSDEQSTFSDPYGGFLIPEGMSPDVLSIQSEADPIAALVTNLPMGSPTIKIPARVDKNHSSSVSGGLTVSRRAEADTSGSSRMQFEQIEYKASGLYGLAYATEELMSDSPQSFAAILDAGFRDEFGAKILNERINGVGGAEFVGVLNSECKVEVSAETGQAASTIVFENIVKMYARAWRPQVWVANRTTIPQLALLNQTVGTGGAPIFMPSAREGFPMTLLGLPIMFTEYCPALGTAGDLILCRWAEYLQGTYEPMQNASSIHVRFVNHERTFKVWTRNAGAPWWSSALTPANGDTLSPFVTLATRA